MRLLVISLLAGQYLRPDSPHIPGHRRHAVLVCEPKTGCDTPFPPLGAGKALRRALRSAAREGAPYGPFLSGWKA
jgi:hypothetical protein